MKKLPISVYFVTKNEEVRLPQALDATVGWADEVLVVDSGSTDNTLKIAESYGVKVIHNDWKGFAAQKSFAEQLCKNDWVFGLDADEEISKELQNELQDLFANDKLPTESAFLINWKTIYPGQIKPTKFAPKNKIIRLYNKKFAQVIYKEFCNHDLPIVKEGKVGRLKESVYHRTILDFNHLEHKITQVTQEQAMYNYKSGKKISSFKFYIDFPFKFLKYYFLKRMFLHGWYGFALSITAAYRNFIRLAKTRELYILEQQKVEK